MPLIKADFENVELPGACISVSDVRDEPRKKLTHFERAGYVRHSRAGGKGRSYSHDLVRQGDVVQVSLSMPLSRVLVAPDDEERASRYFFFVYAILGRSDSQELFAAVRRLVPRNRESGNEFLYTVGQENVQFLAMRENVRRAGIIHMCTADSGCQINWASGTVKHKNGLEEGGACVIVGREDGYPPHMG